MSTGETRRATPARAAAALAIIAIVTAAALLLRLNSTSAGFVLMVGVLFIASRQPLAIAGGSAVAATLSYNFFFFAPVGTLHIEDSENWIALATFLATSLLANRLFVRERALARERERFAALRERDELKTSLLQAVAHDLKSPLTVLAVESEALQRGSVPSPHVEAIRDAVERLSRRIDKLLSAARFEAGVVSPHKEPTPAADLFRAARESLPTIARARPLPTAVRDDTPDLFADPSLALEIVVNLIENAHAASPDAEPVELCAEPSPDGDRVRIEVRDRGRGVPLKHVPGLGMELARTLATLSGGSVAWLARDGGGTVARLDLPAAPGAAA